MLCVPVRAGPAGNPPSSQLPDAVRIADAELAGAVRRALARAEQKLKVPRCRELVSGFTTRPRPPLSDGLQQQDGRPEAPLRELLFYDGSSVPTCDRRQVLAVTLPGARVVRICPRSFLNVARRDAGSQQTSNLLLHELLHYLGLQENSPSPQAITSLIARQCGN